MQIVGDNNRIEHFTGKGPSAGLEVEDARFDPRITRTRGKCRSVAIHGQDACATRGEKPCVAACAGGKIEHPRANRDQRRELRDEG